ncbi:glycosyltransferase [Achromobacter kerstersii]
MIFFIRSYIADFDARMGKYFDALTDAEIPFCFIGWNKDGRPASARRGFRYFSKIAKLGGGWRNAIALLWWNAYVFWQLIKARRQVRVVHAVDLDSGFAAWLFCQMFRRPLVLDLYDKYTAVRNIGGILGKAIDALERMIAKSAALAIIASAERYSQHGLQPNEAKVLVLENVPHAGIERIAPWEVRRPWKIGYFGVLEAQHRGLEDLLSACTGRLDVQLHVAGYGRLAPQFSAASENLPNIHFHGARESAAGLRLMATMDIMVGLYYLSVPNHRHASPNKYYEHLMLGRPLLTTDGTPPGARVDQDVSGWAIGEGAQAITAWLDALTEPAVTERGKRAAQLWSERYESYYLTHYCGEYVARVKQLYVGGRADGL